MPPAAKKKSSAIAPAVVARMPPDEQLMHLTHEYEGLHDRLFQVEQNQGEFGRELGELRGDVTGLKETMGRLSEEAKEAHQVGRENNLLIREIGIFLKGQQTPGLERPGIGADLKALQDTIAANTKELKEGLKTVADKQQTDHDCHQEEIGKLQGTHARIGWIFIGITGVGGASAVAFLPKILKIIDLFK